MSFHFLVRGAGFYLCGAYVPKLQMEGMDDSVYKAEGKQQKFRLPFASKDGKTRVLRRVVMDEDSELTFYDDMNEIEDELEEEYKEYMISNVSYEIERYSIEQAMLEDRDTSEYVAAQGDTGLSYEKLNDLLQCIGDQGQEFSWDQWIKIVWAVMNLVRRYSIEGGEQLVHAFSKLSDKYNITETNVSCWRFA